VAQEPGRQDRRQRLLQLTGAGLQLEAQLTNLQSRRIAAAYRGAGVGAAAGFRTVMLGIMDPSDRAKVAGPDR
jgi:DNA-binding MarR family transcriptional regulator